MSGFDARWLALREPADRHARSTALADDLQRWVARLDARDACAIDLGCGTGANVRFLAPRVGGVRRWVGVDDAPALLEAFARSLPDVEAGVHLMDLSRGLTSLDTFEARVFTASALLDLVSAAWLDSVVAMIHRRGAAALFALSYDGRLELQPAQDADGIVRAAFNAHQRRDKGFGPALGPLAVAAAVSALRAVGYEVRRAASDWRLDAADDGDAALMGPLLEGIAAAAREQAPDESPRIDEWRRARQRELAAGALRVTVGHEDVLGLPGAQ